MTSKIISPKKITNSNQDQLYITTLWNSVTQAKTPKDLNKIFDVEEYLDFFYQLSKTPNITQENLLRSAIVPYPKLWKLTQNLSLKLLMCYKFFRKKVFEIMYDLSAQNKKNLEKDNPNNFFSQKAGNTFEFFAIESEEKLLLFELMLKCYYLDSKLIHDLKLTAGFDFEFNNTHEKSKIIGSASIGLIQLNMACRESRHVYLIDPKLFSDVCKKNVNNLIVQYIFTNTSIAKITHGSDSLDLPYITTKLLCNSPEKIIKLLQNYYDTKLLHEALTNILKENQKSNVYDAMHHLKVITDEDYKYLVDLDKKIGRKDYIVWNLKKLTNRQVEYATGDIMYLHELTEAIKKKLIDHKYENYYQVMLEFQRLAYLDKTLKLFSDFESESNKLNTLLTETKNHTLQQIILLVNQVTESQELIERYQVPSKTFLGVNYLKSTITFLFKLIVYHQLWKNNTVVYLRKNQPENIKKINKIYAQIICRLNEYDFPEILFWIKAIRKHIKKILATN